MRCECGRVVRDRSPWRHGVPSRYNRQTLREPLSTQSGHFRHARKFTKPNPVKAKEPQCQVTPRGFFMRLLPPSNIPQSTIAVSVHLPSHCESSIEQLLPLFENSGVIATWGIADPVGEVAQQIIEMNSRHEVALLLGIESNWRRDSRVRLEAASRDAKTISTIAASSAVGDDRLERRARYGISMIARVGANESTKRPSVVTRRFGLWEVPAAIHIPALPKASDWRIRHTIDHAIAGGRLLHMTIDVSASNISTVISCVERVFSHIGHRRQERRIVMRTMSEIAVEFRRRPICPAQSILRVEASLPHAA